MTFKTLRHVQFCGDEILAQQNLTLMHFLKVQTWFTGSVLSYWELFDEWFNYITTMRCDSVFHSTAKIL